MKKVFISVPMSGINDEEIHKSMNDARVKICKYLGEGYQMLDSFIYDVYDSPLMYVAKSIEILSQADYAYFVEGWQNYRGCRIERACCQEYGIPIIEDWMVTNTINEDNRFDL